MEKTENKAKKKGTTSSEAIIGTGVIKLEQAITNLLAMKDVLANLPKLIEEQSIKLADTEERTREIDVQYAEKLRAAKIKLEFDIKEITATVVQGYLASVGQVAIDRDEHQNLLKTIEKMELDHDAEIKKEVAIATNSLKSKYEADLKLLEATNKTQEATNIATIKSLQDQLIALKADRDQWKSALDDERKASVERAKAASVGAINIASPSGR